MKTIKTKKLIIFLFFFLVGSGIQTTQAQFLKKLKEKVLVLGKENPHKGLIISNKNQVFIDWDKGTSDIVVFINTESNSSKRTHIVGKIDENGRFSYQLPDSIDTSVPIQAWAQGCTNSKEAVINNPEVKIAAAILLVGQNKQFIGGITPVNPVEAVFNTGKNVEETRAEIGDYYLLVYADGDASISIKCNNSKKFSAKDVEGKTHKAVSNIDIELQKGWNLLRTRVTEKVPVGMSIHVVMNELAIVNELPDDIKWVYRPDEK